jgi:hypothetical protein
LKSYLEQRLLMAYSFAIHAQDLEKTLAKGGAGPCKHQGEGARRVPPIATVAAKIA